MTAKTLMVQGTASGVGKSILVTALCRLFRQDGWRVAPFKAQNMSLNSFVTREGGEMGRAQVVQAEAAGVEPAVEMNPILLKPEAEARSQVVVLGRPAFTVGAKEYYRHKARLWKVVREALERLLQQYDLVIIEGAGSPAEINLRRHEIVNMRVAKAAQAPVLLMGDIDRGGVFAALVGTLALLEPEERSLIRGFVVNKFRGDGALLKPGLRELERRTGVPVLGVLPYLTNLAIPQEDSLWEPLERPEPAAAGALEVAVIRLPRMANATDFEPLHQEPEVRVRYVTSGAELGQPDLLVIPGTKSTVADLEFLRSTGLDEAILAAAERGTPLLGICGGFQILGKEIRDPLGVESGRGTVPGLGLLDVTTCFASQKTTCRVRAVALGNVGILAGLAGQEVGAYEIHMGQTHSREATSLFRILERGGRTVEHPDGAVSARGNVFGTYLHGLFDNQGFRRALLANLRARRGLPPPAVLASPSREEQYDALAAVIRQHLDVGHLYRLCGLRGRRG